MPLVGAVHRIISGLREASPNPNRNTLYQYTP